MGIPGSIVDIYLISGMMVHHVEPGPMLVTNHPAVFYGIIAAAFIANVFMFVMMSGAGGFIAKLTTVPKALTLPIILVFCVIGATTSGNRLMSWRYRVMSVP
jgi:putative tricarboxylic transport membrane protein